MCLVKKVTYLFWLSLKMGIDSDQVVILKNLGELHLGIYALTYLEI